MAVWVVGGVAVAVVGAIVGLVLWGLNGPRSEYALECTIDQEPVREFSRAGQQWRVETSCGTLDISGGDAAPLRDAVVVGGRYSMVVKSDPFGNHWIDGLRPPADYELDPRTCGYGEDTLYRAL